MAAAAYQSMDIPRDNYSKACMHICFDLAAVFSCPCLAGSC